MISTELTIKLIEAFKRNSRKDVDNIIKEMIAVSEKKKNFSTSKLLRSVYSLPYSDNNMNFNSSSSSPINSVHQEKDTLYEFRNSTVTSKNIVLSADQFDILKEIELSYKKREFLQKNNIINDNKLLLYGPPGTGKTLFAYVLAGELKVPIIHIYIDTLISSYLGETGKNIRKIFQEASSQDCLIFLDEFDSIGKQRDDNQDLSEFKRVVAVLLQNIDEVGPNNILVAATNHDHLIDKAIRRRFTYEVNMEVLDEEARNRLLHLYLDTYGNFDIDVMAKVSINLSGANMKQVVNKAVKKWFLSDKKNNINDLIIEDLAYSFLRHNKIDTKKSEDVNLLIQLIKHLWKHNKKKYTYKYLEELTKIPDSTLNKLVKHYE